MRRLAFRLAVLLIAGSGLALADDLENAYLSLKDAASKRDTTQVKILAEKTFALTRQAMAAPAPEGETEKEAWTKHTAYLKDIELFAEWALSSTAIQSQPAVTIDLLSTLERENPKSKYLDETYGTYLMALTQTGGTLKASDLAEKAIAQFPDNEDLLLVLADSAMSRKQSDGALNYSRRLVAVLSKHPKPEGISAADWERKRTAALGRAQWIAGIVQSGKNQYIEADKYLRAALPLIKGNQAMLAETLFNLGVVNYQLGRMMMLKTRVLEGAQFSEQAAAIPGPFAQQAWHNALVMKNEAGKMR